MYIKTSATALTLALMLGIPLAEELFPYDAAGCYLPNAIDCHGRLPGGNNKVPTIPINARITLTAVSSASAAYSYSLPPIFDSASVPLFTVISSGSNI